MLKNDFASTHYLRMSFPEVFKSEIFYSYSGVFIFRSIQSEIFKLNDSTS